MEEVGWNEVLRFLLELVALFALGAGGWSIGDGSGRWVLAILLPVLAAVAWGTFRVPDDPGPARVPIPGWARLIIEALVMGGGAIGLGAAYGPQAAWTFIGLVLFHYLMGLDRLRWLLQQ